MAPKMELEEEITELEKRFAEAPESRLFLPLADALARAGELERALQLCRKGLESYPDFSAARVLMARCLAELDRAEDAEHLYREIVSADQGNVVALKSLGNLAQERGDVEQACSLYRKAYTLDGEDLELSRALEALEHEQAAREAEPQLSAGIADEPGPQAAVEAQGVEEDLTFDREQPGEVFITHTLADIYRLQGHLERSRRIYEKLLAEDPGNETLRRCLDEVTSRLAGREPAAAASLAESARPSPEPSVSEAGEEFEIDSISPAPGPQQLEEPVPAGSPKPAALGDELTGRVSGIFDQVLGYQSSGTPAAGPEAGDSWGDQPDEYLESLERWLEDLKSRSPDE